MLGVQALGVIAVAGWAAITTWSLFRILKNSVGLRMPAMEEIRGLDIEEHGLISSYADFMPILNHGELPVGDSTEPPVLATPVEKAIPVLVKAKPDTDDGSPEKITIVDIVTKQSMFERLKAAMNQIGVTGMTVTQALGCGMQKGRPEYYRGVEMETMLLPKIEVEMVVCKIPVRTVIEAAKALLYTGHIGDGKIFV